MKKTVYCPNCKSTKPMIKAGRAYSSCDYMSGGKQRWLCTKCRHYTVNPRKEPR